MNEVHQKQKYYSTCLVCSGQARLLQGPSKRRRRRYKREMEIYNRYGDSHIRPQKPVQSMDICGFCNGSGLRLVDTPNLINEQYPKIAIIGGGIGGAALAVACLHRGIPFTLYERDASFDARTQGYGLTLQQASKAMAELGITELAQGVISTKHIVHQQSGELIGEWGLRKWVTDDVPENNKRKNIHIARQSLRQLLLDQLPDNADIKWNHKLVGISCDDAVMEFETAAGAKRYSSDLIVGADGIRSTTRNVIVTKKQSSLKYLGCIVVLGICALDNLGNTEHPLCDSETVFQTVNGHERVYVMPYDKDHIMWQFSVPMNEAEALQMNQLGASVMKKHIVERLVRWHDPIPDIIKNTQDEKITGYPVYDRDPFKPKDVSSAKNITLIGDAIHPMSPFKGQGANQALLDALALARSITKNCQSEEWRLGGLRDLVLNDFEKNMSKRTEKKVTDSRTAARVLHSDAVLKKHDGPRGK